MIRLLDRWLYGAVTHGWPRPRVDNYIEVLRVDDPESALPNVISRTFQLIDTKASGLLTHTSMMIAALGVAGRLVADSYVEAGVIVVEIMLYLLVAVACLRCMAIFNEHSVANGTSPVSNAVRDELILRRELYMMCNRAAIVLTALIFVSLPILYFYVP
jgi:hypothetical protein